MARAQALANRTKAAILLMAMGPEVCGRIFQHLSDDEVEMLTIELAKLGMVHAAERNAVVAEFRELCQAQEYISEGGMDHARKFLETAYGADRAGQIISRVVQALQVLPFDFVKKADPTQLLGYIQEEHPQTIALILAHLPAKLAAGVLAGLSQETRAEVARRIAIMQGPSARGPSRVRHQETSSNEH